MKKTNKQIILEIQVLLGELLKTVDSESEVKGATKDASYSGCNGGLRLLADENFFDDPRTKQEVVSKLVEMGRHYSSPLVSMNLLNLCKERLLIKLGKAGSYKFVIRK